MYDIILYYYIFTLIIPFRLESSAKNRGKKDCGNHGKKSFSSGMHKYGLF